MDNLEIRNLYFQVREAFDRRGELDAPWIQNYYSKVRFLDLPTMSEKQREEADSLNIKQPIWAVYTDIDEWKTWNYGVFERIESDLSTGKGFRFETHKVLTRISIDEFGTPALTILPKVIIFPEDKEKYGWSAFIRSGRKIDRFSRQELADIEELDTIYQNH